MKILYSWGLLRSTLLLFSLIPSFFALAQKTTIKVELENRSPFYVRSYDSSGIIYVSVSDYATSVSLPFVINAARKKIEVRLTDHRIKLTARNPYLVITDAGTNASSVYQLPADVLYLDSLYYVAATPFFNLLERFSPLGISFDPDARRISKGSIAAKPRFDITGVEIEQRLNGYLLTIKANRRLGDFNAFLKPDGWLYVTIVDATADTAALQQFKSQGVIRRILTFQSPTSVQLTFQVSSDVAQVDPILEEGTNNLLIALHTKHEIEKAELERKRQEQIRERLESERSRSKLDVIVIDPGHGGKDPGTIGVRGTMEKDVALGVGLKLGRLIERNLKGVKVVYTRKTDVFVELYRRTQMANEANGKLFVSIHCNSTELKPSSANGFEIYLLRPGKTESAIRIAEQENSAVELEEGYQDRYKELTEENFILVTMRQSAFAKHSEQFAEVGAEAMARHLKIQNSGVKQAGFYVLVGASMPNVLVETGYLSNRKEEKILKSSQGQQKIAEALFQGIKEYKAKYEQALQEGRANDQQEN